MLTHALARSQGESANLPSIRRLPSRLSAIPDSPFAKLRLPGEQSNVLVLERETVTNRHPVPESATWCGLPAALLTITSSPVLAPSSRATKLTSTVQLPPTGSVPAQWFTA